MAAPETTKRGQWSEWMDADETVTEICKKLQPEVEKKTEHNFSRFDALTYQDQVVAGRNYRIKVYAGVDKCVILQVFQDLHQVDHLKNAKVLPLPTINFSD